MQAESGIVPDFEVGEEFQEEPKTYYELKSQPLKKNRSVFWLCTAILCGKEEFDIRGMFAKVLIIVEMFFFVWV